MVVKLAALQNYVNTPEEEIKNITSSFGDHVKLVGKDTPYRPRIVFYDFFGYKSFGIASRPYVDQSDYMTCIAEMMYAYSALSSEACVLVLDSYITKNGQNVGNCLYCYFIGDKSAHMACLPYSYSNDEVVWDLSKQTSEEIDLKDHDGMTQQMVELLYAYSHLDKPPFSLSDLLSYYSSMNYQFRAFKNLKTPYIDFSKTN